MHAGVKKSREENDRTRLLVLQISLAAVEMASWGMDLPEWLSVPKNKLPSGARLLGFVARGLSHLWGASQFYGRSDQGQKVYIIFVVSYTAMLVQDWWLPYVFGLISPKRLRMYQKATRTALKILPSLGSDRLTPTLEQTALLGLALSVCFRSWRVAGGPCRLDDLWVLMTLVCMGMPVGLMGAKNWNFKDPDVVGLGIAALVTLGNAVLLLYLRQVQRLHQLASKAHEMFEINKLVDTLSNTLRQQYGKPEKCAQITDVAGGKQEDDPPPPRKPVLFERKSSKTRIPVFDSRHQESLIPLRLAQLRSRDRRSRQRRAHSAPMTLAELESSLLRDFHSLVPDDEGFMNLSTRPSRCNS